MNQSQQPLMSHLVELRSRLLRSFSAILLVFLALVYFASDIYSILAEPLLKQMPEGGSMIATGVATPFLTPMKLTLILSFFIAIPYVLYQVWAFIAPGLYKHEQRLIAPLVFSSALLFYAGAAFAYYVVFPLAFGFFNQMTPVGVTIATDMSLYSAIFSARLAAGLSDSLISLRYTMFAAPSAPITATVAVGQAYTASAPMSRLFMARYAPP